MMIDNTAALEQRLREDANTLRSLADAPGTTNREFAPWLDNAALLHSEAADTLAAQRQKIDELLALCDVWSETPGRMQTGYVVAEIRAILDPTAATREVENG